MQRTLKDLKDDFTVLLELYQDLGGVISSDRNHNPCPICKDETAFALYEKNKKTGRPSWRCFKCGVGGSVVDLVKAYRQCDRKDAVRFVVSRYKDGAPEAGVRPEPGPAPVVVPVKKPKKIHLTIDDAVKACLWGLTQRDGVTNVTEFARWRYQRNEGDPGFYVVRYDFDRTRGEGTDRCKEIRFIRYGSGGWITDKGEWGSVGNLCPLLYLPAFDGIGPLDATLHVVEGEKCATALRDLGLITTTSQGGSGRAEETDWAPAARCSRVIIWMDCDDPGYAYCDAVARQIMRHGSPQIVEVDLRQMGFKDGQDVFDLVAEMVAEGKEQQAIVSELTAIATRYGTPWLESLPPVFPGQPAPFDPDTINDGNRPEIANWRWIEKKGTNPDTGEPTVEKKTDYIPIRDVVRRVMAVGNGWPVRLRSKHARNPSLFLDQVSMLPEGQIRFFDKAEQFAALLHELGRPSFRDKRDWRGSNFVSIGQLLCAIGDGAGMREYVQPEIRPHWPPYREHYYAYRPAQGYRPTGRALAGFLQFFDNFVSPVDRAIAAAAVLTPGWGGPYGRRPLMVMKGRHTGSGKTTFAQYCGRIWGGVFGSELDQRSEEQLRERLLSYESLFYRIALLDDVAGYLRTEKVQRLLTCEWIDGKRMYVGNASRPNTLTWFLTTNSFRISTDMAHRTYVMEVNPPSNAVTRWDERLRAYIDEHLHEIVADAIAILRWAPPVVDVGTGDRWAEWVDSVLVRACVHPVLSKWIGGVSVKEVLQQNQQQRDTYDADKGEGTLFDQTICEWVSEKRSWVTLEMGAVVVKPPRTADGKLEQVWISSKDLCDLWEDCFEKRFGPKELKGMINAHIAAGRIKSVSEWTHTRDGNGCWLLERAVEEWLPIAQERHGVRNA